MGLFECILGSAADMVRGANDRSVRGLIETIFERIKRSPDLINPKLLFDIVKVLTQSVLGSIFGTVGSVSSIRDAVFRNEVNATTLILIRDQAAELARFGLDLMEATKCYKLENGKHDEKDEHVLYAEFNELNFSETMNRHAVICQIQRLARSILYILLNMFHSISFMDINMSEETKLRSDLGTALQETISTEDGPGEVDVKDVPIRDGKVGPGTPVAVSKADERWFFIKGVFKRGDGLLWDLIECAGQRSSYIASHDRENVSTRPDVDAIVKGQRHLIDNTASSKEAQKNLLRHLKSALDKCESKPHIVIIAHSQGCLLLRRVLEDLITTATNNPKLKDTMREHLCVFTFGNPSLHWKTQGIHPRPSPDADGAYLSSHVLRTEHFANRRDFVARLGVLSEDREYGADEIYTNENEDWIGHLFGTQYSFNSEHYESSHGQHSWLLGCRFGRTIGQAQAGKIPVT
ncbi:hypothetical protein BDV12DRAFT_210339 [Aspergillus spectabilis]